jgi:ribose transport system substrate-binding protein
MRVAKALIVTVAGAALTLTGCSSGSSSSAESSAPAEPAASAAASTAASAASDCTPVTGPVKIGFSQVTLQSPFYVELQKGAEAAATANGAELLFVDANGDVTKQNNDIQDLITKGVNVLIINPANPDAVKPSLDAAAAAGIPVITVDRPVTAGAVAHVGRDNKAMGKLVGEAVAAAMGEEGGQIIEIQGDAGGVVMADRRDGFADGIAANPKAEIVLGPYAEYIRSNAVTAMQDLLQANPDVKVIYAHNDDMALGAMQVLQEAGRDDVLVAGVDGLGEALQSMADGSSYVATALNDPKYLGDTTIQAALALAACNSVPAFIDAGTALVDQSNAKDYVSESLFAEYRPDLGLQP